MTALRSPLLLPLVLAAACATSRGRTPARAALDAWVAGASDAAARAATEAVSAAPADPWARLAAAEAARSALDPEAEARHLLALVDARPEHPLATLAIRRVDDLADLSPPLARSVEHALGTMLDAGRLRGLAAFRARAARASAAEAQGDVRGAAAHRARNGTVEAWTLIGPLGAYHALELERPFRPESGPFPERMAGSPGVGEVSARAVPASSGALVLEGEPGGADVYYVAADLAVATGGDYLFALGSGSSWRAWLDGEPLSERRAHEGWLPLTQVTPRRLAPGTHRLLVKLARGQGRGNLAATIARADGAPSDVVARPASTAAPAAGVAGGAFPSSAHAAADLVAALEPEAGPVLARILAARDLSLSDRERAKRLLAEAAALAPASAAVAEATALVQEGDPTLPEGTARARAESSLARAAALAPGAALPRAELARLALDADRHDDAAEHLDALASGARERPSALLLRARLARARGFWPGAEEAAERAHRAGALCGATELLLQSAGRRSAVAREDELARAFAHCRGGATRLGDHLLRRGDLGGAVEVRERIARAAPARVEARLDLVAALLAAGEAARAARELEELARIWPRDARIEKRRADALEAAGDAAAARAARERALAIDGSDLELRRGLALEDGSELLADLAEDGPASLAAYRAAAPREETSSVFVLDAAADEVQRVGSLLERVHQIVKVLDERAADRYGEVTLPPGAQIVTLRTLKKDGRVLEPEETGGGERDAASLPGLEPGDFAEVEFLRASPPRGSQLPGFTADTFVFRADAPMWRSSYVLRAPAGTGLRVEARGMEPPAPRADGALEVVRARAERVPPVRHEPSAPDEAEYLPGIRVGAGAGPDALARAVGDGFADRTRPSAEVAALAHEIAGSLSQADRGTDRLVRAAYAAVAARVTGTGGSLADSAAHVLARGRGSRVVLLASVLRALGVDVRVALVREFARDPAPSGFPRPDLYSRPVLRVRHGGATWWLDPAQRLAPFGALPASARGAEALLVPAVGEEPQVVHTPPDDPDAREVEVRIALAEDGSASLEGSETYRGYDGALVKASLERIDVPSRRQALEGALTRSFRGLAVEDATFEGEGDAEAPLVIRWRARVPAWAQVDGRTAVAEVPVFPARLGAHYASLASRETPLLVANGEEVRLRISVAAPPGWRAVPQQRDVDGPYGGYRRDERASPAGLAREDRFTLRRGRIGPDEYPRFATFANAVDAAQAAPMRFERGDPGT